MKRICFSILFYLLYANVSAQNPLSIKDSADKLMLTDMEKAITLYRDFLSATSKQQNLWLPFIYETYDSIYTAAGLTGKYHLAEKAAQEAFEVALKYNDRTVLNDRLTFLNGFYKTALRDNWLLPYKYTSGKERQMVLPVIKVKQLTTDSCLVTFAGGKAEGLKPGQEVECVGVKQPFLETDRSSNSLGRGFIQTVSDNYSTVVIQQTYSSDSTDYVYPGDMIYCTAYPGYKSDIGAYQFLADYNIAFQDNYRQQPYHHRQLLFYAIPNQQVLLDSFFLSAVKEVADMLYDDTSGKFRYYISNGLLKGRYMTRALAATKVEHIRSFLKYVQTFPGKYYGQKFKFSEVYATWLINSSPLSEAGLMELLVEYKGKPFYDELLASYDSSIVQGNNWNYWKNEFLDSLDKGSYNPQHWDVLQSTARYYKDSTMLVWLQVLEGRLLAFRSARKPALAMLEEAEKYFETHKMQEEMLFVKTQLQQVNNQRIAKVAVQTSHFLPYSVSFSPNGKYFATYGDDYTIKIWDAKLVRQVTTINAHTSSVNKVTFSANNRYFVSASDDETIRIWDMGSLLLYKTITTGYRVKYATLNKLGDKIIAAGSDSCIKIYDFQTGKVDSVYRIHNAKVNTGDYNPEYQNIFYSGGSDSMAYAVNISTGNWIRWFKSGGRVATVKVTTDRRYIAVLGDNGQIKVWQMNGKFKGSFPSFKYKYGSEPTSPDILSGFDILPGKKMIAFVNQSKQLCLGSLDSMTYYNFDLKLDNNILDVAFHPSGNSIILTTMMGKMYLVNLRQYNLGQADSIQWVSVGSRSNMISSMAFSSDGKMFAFQSGSTYLLNLATGKTTSWGEESFGQLRGNINFTKNDSRIFYVPLDGQRVQEQNLTSGDTTYILSTKPYFIAFQNLSPDKKIFVAGFYKKAYVFYDVETKAPLHTIPLDSVTHSQISGVTFIAGTNRVVVNNDVDNCLSFYTLDQKILHPYSRYKSKQESAFYSVVHYPAKNEIIAGCQDNNLYFFDAQTGELKDTLSFNYIDKNEGVSVLKLFPDGKKLFIGLNTRMFIFDLDTRKIISNFDNENYILTSAEIDPSGDLIAVGTFTGVIYFYETNTFTRVLEVQTFTDKEPVWITPDNYYISSKASLKELYFKFNNSLYPFDQFDINFNRPDKVLEKLGKIDEQLLTAYKEAWTKRFKKSGIPESRLRPDFKVPEVKIINQDNIPPIATKSTIINLELEFIDADTTITSYNIWVNGIPEYGTRGKQIKNPSKHLMVSDSIRLTGANNVIQVACKNINGVESLKEKFEVRNFVTDTNARKTYLFVVSVSDYKDKRYNLQYARKDGRDLVNAFKEKYKQNLVVDTLFDEKAVLKNILAWKSKLLKTRMTDRVIMYVSGHGVLDKNFDFFYATQNIDFKNPADKGLAYEEIERLLDSIPARQKLLLMDACHSGEVDKDDVVVADKALTKSDPSVQVVYKSKGVGEEAGTKPRLGLSNSFELMQDLFANLNSGNGTVVISAAAGNSYAYESDVWKNGVFTYSILHGLIDRAADLDHNYRVSVSELQRYVSTQVQKLTKGAQKPTARQENLENDWLVW